MMRSASLPRVVITGVGLTSPNGNDLATFRQNLLQRVSGVGPFETRHMGAVIAGVCDYDERRHQSRKARRRGTRAGSIAIYCAHEAVLASGLEWEAVNPARVGVFVGTTEHGNVETENEIANLREYGDEVDLLIWDSGKSPCNQYIFLLFPVNFPHRSNQIPLMATNQGRQNI